MTKVRIGTDTDGRDDRCECCGYPFDRGDTAYDMTDGFGPLACSKKCADWLVDEECRKHRNEPQNLACFV